MDRVFFVIGAVSACLGVGLGAYGSHGLPKYLKKRYEKEPERAIKLQGTWETAVRYHMYHALALFAVAWGLTRWPEAAGSGAAAGWLLIGGSIIFSGTLYGVCLTGIRWLGAITPIGGVALMVGWLCLAWAAWKG